MGLLKDFEWRYATKKFDSTKKIEQPLVDQIIEAAWLAPTSSGLQPFRVIEITDEDLKKKIVPIAYNQQQVADCSHLLLFAGWDNYSEERINNIYKCIALERGQNPDFYNSYTERLKKTYTSQSEEENFKHIVHLIYLAFGFAIAMAAELKIDSTPMEGFDTEELDKLLDLNKEGLRSVLLLPLGYRDEDNDWLVNQKKVRHPKKEFLLKI